MGRPSAEAAEPQLLLLLGPHTPSPGELTILWPQEQVSPTWESGGNKWGSPCCIWSTVTVPHHPPLPSLILNTNIVWTCYLKIKTDYRKTMTRGRKSSMGKCLLSKGPIRIQFSVIVDSGQNKAISLVYLLFLKSPDCQAYEWLSLFVYNAKKQDLKMGMAQEKVNLAWRENRTKEKV